MIEAYGIFRSILFGAPIVLNPVLFVPFILAPQMASMFDELKHDCDEKGVPAPVPISLTALFYFC